MTVEPIYTPATERTYASLAGLRRAADRASGTFPLKRFLSAVLDQFGRVWQLFERIDALAPDEYGADNEPLTLYSNLALNPSYEDAAPLPAGTTNATASRVEGTASWTDDGDYAWQFIAAANGTFGGVVTPARVVAVPGPLRVSIDVWSVAGRTVRVQAQPVTAAGAAIGGPVLVDTAYVGPGYQRVDVSLLMPATTAGADISVLVLAGVAAEQVLVDCLLTAQLAVSVPYVRYTGVLTGETSDLGNPDTADDDWLDWLGQLVGVRLPLALTRAGRVDAVKYASAGWQSGTKIAVTNAAKTALTGSQYAVIYDHSTDAANGIGAGTMWDVLIVTRAGETASTAAVLAAVNAKGAKPAGVTLHIRAYNATWAQIVGQYPTWAAIRAAGSWAKIEEAGLV